LSAATRARAAEREERAGQRLQAGDPLDALGEYRSAVALDPRNAALLYRAGKTALEATHYPEAKLLLQRALEEDICPLRALTSMREITRRAAEKSGSLFLDFTDTLECKTQREVGHPILGEPHFVDHVHLSVEEYRHLALSIARRMGEAGILRPMPGWEPGAVRLVSDFRMARFGDEERAAGLHRIAMVLNWAGKHDDAMRIAENALRWDSASAEAAATSLIVGLARERADHTAEAIPHYLRAVRIRPDHLRGRRALGMALLRNGETQGAEAQMRAALALGPRDPETLKEMGAVLMALGRAGEALSHLEQSGKIDPGDEETFLLLNQARGILAAKNRP
jgi:tetratricopeptide (TPR) repeat protein